MAHLIDSSQCAVRESINIALRNSININSDGLKKFQDMLDKSSGSSNGSKGQK